MSNDRTVPDGLGGTGKFACMLGLLGFLLATGAILRPKGGAPWLDPISFHSNRWQAGPIELASLLVLTAALVISLTHLRADGEAARKLRLAIACSALALLAVPLIPFGKLAAQVVNGALLLGCPILSFRHLRAETPTARRLRWTILLSGFGMAILSLLFTALDSLPGDYLRSTPELERAARCFVLQGPIVWVVTFLGLATWGALSGLRPVWALVLPFLPIPVVPLFELGALLLGVTVYVVCPAALVTAIVLGLWAARRGARPRWAVVLVLVVLSLVLLLAACLAFMLLLEVASLAH